MHLRPHTAGRLQTHGKTSTEHTVFPCYHTIHLVSDFPFHTLSSVHTYVQAPCASNCVLCTMYMVVWEEGRQHKARQGVGNSRACHDKMLGKGTSSSRAPTVADCGAAMIVSATLAPRARCSYFVCDAVVFKSCQDVSPSHATKIQIQPIRIRIYRVDTIRI